MSSAESDVLTDYSQLHVAIAAGKKRRQIDDKDITRTRHTYGILRNSNISYFTSLYIQKCLIPPKLRYYSCSLRLFLTDNNVHFVSLLNFIV